MEEKLALGDAGDPLLLPYLLIKRVKSTNTAECVQKHQYESDLEF